MNYSGREFSCLNIVLQKQQSVIEFFFHEADAEKMVTIQNLIQPLH